MRIIGGLGIALCCTLAGCKATPESTFKAMQKAACAGDVPGFFKYVDKTKLAESVTKKVREHTAEQGSAPGALGAAMVDAIAPQAVQKMMTEWEDDIKHGKDSNWCKAKFDSAINSDGRVNWLTPTGRERIGVFEKAGDGYLLVDFDDPPADPE